MKLLSLTLLMTLGWTQTSFASPWGDYLRNGIIARKGMETFFPDPELLKGWSQNREYVSSKTLSPNEVQEIPLSCQSTKLWATHPQQTTKEYLFAVWSHYDHGRLPISSEACERPSPSKRFCSRASTANILVMSDTYQDTCGNYYRGYWITTFLSAHESMGTLVSKGRVFYIDADGSNFKLGSTYPVKKSDFLMLGKLLPGDVARIKKERADALRFGVKRQGLGFVAPN